MKTAGLNIIRSIFSFLFMQNHKPSYLLFFVTSKCEASCKHCFYWKEINRINKELSLAEITELARKLGPVVQVTITGGSPELRTDLYEILHAFIKYCTPINITLCSNGNHPDILYRTAKKVLADFRDLHLTVDISLDGLYEKHDSIRGINGLFGNVVQSYSMLEGLKKEYPNLRLGCGMVVSGLNNGSAEETAEWAVQNLPVDNFTPVLVRGEPREKEALNVHPDVFRNISDRTEELLLKGRLKGYSAFTRIINAKDIIQKKLICRIYKERRCIIRCSALRETAVIYPDGTVGCCELRSESPGNLRDFNMSLKDLWQSAVTKKIRKSVARENCYCWHQCFLSASIIKSPGMWAEIIKLVLRQK